MEGGASVPVVLMGNCWSKAVVVGVVQHRGGRDSEDERVDREADGGVWAGPLGEGGDAATPRAPRAVAMATKLDGGAFLFVFYLFYMNEKIKILASG